jgi:hypothetical protein
VVENTELWIFLALALLAAVLVHAVIRRYLLASAVAGTLASGANLAHELIRAHGGVGPSDIAFWLPLLFVVGWVISFVVALLVGIPFAVSRRQRQTKPERNP